MSRDMESLDPEFRQNVESALESALKEGVEMRVFYTLRTPQEQAKLWRQSRPGSVIRSKVSELRRLGCTYLPELIASVGPCYGHHVTNAIPGLSWHQWGEAVDAFWLLDGDACWSTRKIAPILTRYPWTSVSAPPVEENGYRVWARCAEEFDLVAGGHWRRFVDWPHVQKRSENAGARLTMDQIDDEMRKRFDGNGEPWKAPSR